MSFLSRAREHVHYLSVAADGGRGRPRELGRVLRRQPVPREQRRETVVVFRRSIHQGAEHHRVRASELVQNAPLLRPAISQSRMVSVDYSKYHCYYSFAIYIYMYIPYIDFRSRPVLLYDVERIPNIRFSFP